MPDSTTRQTSSPKGYARLERIDARRIAVIFAGSWRIGAQVPSTDDIVALIRGGGIAEVVVDGKDLSEWDSTLMMVIRRIEAACKESAARLDCERLPSALRGLLRLTEEHAESIEIASPPSEPVTLAERVGDATHRVIDACSVFIEFVGEATIAFWHFCIGRARFRGSDLGLVLQQSGAQALPIVALISVLIGLILAFVGAIQFRQFGVELYVANLVAIAMLREMGAIMTGIIMAGRTGAAFAAELGTMQVNEEIDALRTSGFDPMEFLVLPRMLALIVMMPLLCLYADALGIAGGALIGVTILGLPWVEYWNQTQNAMTMSNFLIGLSKASVFGVIIALSGCLKGMQSGRSAAAVGIATTSAVVVAIVLIVAADGLFAVVLNMLGL
jgi:phospholipid/cholesterol/gamma-HCH transport system permease protein